MTPETRARLDEIREREKAATPGPWEEHGNGIEPKIDNSCWDRGYVVGAKIQKSRDGLICVRVCDMHPLGSHDENAANRAFIAHIRNELPWLLDLIERQTAEIERLKG